MSSLSITTVSDASATTTSATLTIWKAVSLSQVGLPPLLFPLIPLFATDHSGYTGQLNNLDYTVRIDQEYGFCGTEFYQELEPGSFSLTNKTDLAENFQV